MSRVEKQWSWDDSKPDTDYEGIADVEWVGESYEFDMTRVYRKISTGELFYAEDSGCSCPSPFEDVEESDLTPITRMQDWYDHIAARTIYPDPGETFQCPGPTPTSAIDEAHRAATVINAHFRNTKENN